MEALCAAADAELWRTSESLRNANEREQQLRYDQSEWRAQVEVLRQAVAAAASSASCAEGRIQQQERALAANQQELATARNQLDVLRCALQRQSQQSEAAASDGTPEERATLKQVQSLRDELDVECQTAADAIAASKSDETLLQQQFESLLTEMKTKQKEAEDASGAHALTVSRDSCTYPQRHTQ
eukprot:364426-Chlamydomonas_euryale.AAC.21